MYFYKIIIFLIKTVLFFHLCVTDKFNLLSMWGFFTIETKPLFDSHYLLEKQSVNTPIQFLPFIRNKTEFEVKMNFQILLLVSLVAIASGDDCPYCWQGCFPQVMTAGNKL